MRHIRVVNLFGLSVVIESTIKGIAIGDTLTENTILDLSVLGIPVLVQSKHEVV